jgi:hypothetical protein
MKFDAEHEELERQAVALITTYGAFLPKPVKAFFKRLAVHLQWKNLEKKL